MRYVDICKESFYYSFLVPKRNAREVLEPEAIGDAHDSESGGDDDKILVSPTLTAGWQDLVLGTPGKCPNMKTVQRYVVRVS